MVIRHDSQRMNKKLCKKLFGRPNHHQLLNEQVDTTLFCYLSTLNCQEHSLTIQETGKKNLIFHCVIDYSVQHHFYIKPVIQSSFDRYNQASIELYLVPLSSSWSCMASSPRKMGRIVFFVLRELFCGEPWWWEGGYFGEECCFLVLSRVI